MSKYVKFLILAILAVGLMSGSAFAAASLNAGNTTIASELVPAAGIAVPAPGVNNAYQPAGAVAASSQLKISLTNGTFAAGNIALCDSAGAAYGTVATVAAATSATITTTVALASGTAYNLQPAAVCVAGPSPLTNVNIAAGAVGGAVVTMTVDNALSAGDTNIYAMAPVITLVNQLSAAIITPAVDVLDFGASPVMSKFKAGGSGATVTESRAKLVVLTDETIGTKIATGHTNTACAAWPATAEALSFTATPGSGTTMGTGFHATTAFQAQEGALVAAKAILKAAILSTDASATGNAALTAGLTALSCGAGSSATLKGTAANQINALLTVTGTTALTARSYKLAVGTTTSGAIVAAAREILAATTAWTWGMDASQYYIPLVGSVPTSGRETYIKLQSKNVQSGSNGVSVAILSNDGTTAATFTGTITAGTPLTITGAELVAAATAAGKVVDGLAGFAVIVTVNSPEADVFVYANITEASGNTKRIPVKTVAGAISE